MSEELANSAGGPASGQLEDEGKQQVERKGEKERREGGRRGEERREEDSG